MKEIKQNNKMVKIYSLLILAMLFIGCAKEKVEETKKPNVIIVYVDDLGFGDIGANGAVGVKTPNLDKLATNGLNFTDAHCSAATCTPSRFSLLTGSYAFRNKAKVLEGDAPLLIDPNKGTMPKMFKASGYKTAVVGKWHLGLGDGNIDWNSRITLGPAELGFDYSFLIPATGDRVPCVYLENQEVVNLDINDKLYVNYKERIGELPIGTENKESLLQIADPQHSGTVINNVSRIGYMTGGESAWWVDEDFPEIITSKAKNFIKTNQSHPFFLYLSYHDIHVPRVPNKKFQESSEMGVRGDAIAQMDWCTGEIVKYLEELNLDKNTLIVFTSDNGPVLDDGYADEAVERIGSHKPAGPYRGGKYSAFEGGTRVPTIVYWPGKVKAGKSNALWSQVDLFASLAALLNFDLESDEAIDSFNMLPTILGKESKGRDLMLEESYTLSIRKGNWKYIEPAKSKASWIEGTKGIESGLEFEPQLYNLSEDLGENTNVASQNEDLVKELQTEIDKIRENNTRIVKK